MSGPNGHTRRERMRHDIAAEEAAVEAEPLATPWGAGVAPGKAEAH